MSEARPRRLLWAVAVASCLLLIVVSVQDRREAARAAAQAREAQARAAAETSRQSTTLAALTASLAQTASRAQRDGEAASTINASLDLVAAYRQRIARADAERAPLEETKAEQEARLETLRGCIRTLDAVRTHLERGDAAAATATLARGRDACARAESVSGGIAASVHPYDFPDPFVLADDGHYFAFGTNGPAGTIQVITSPDLDEWSIGGSALAGVPAWAEPGRTWAPSVLRVLDGYRLYYTVTHAAWGIQCITVAHATVVTGPYVDDTTGPLVCQRDLGGSIDPSPFRGNDGRAHLTWKSEGETVGGAAQIWSQELRLDGRALVGAATPLIVADRGWEDGVVEAPSMAPVDGTWLLLYSGNRWNGDRYAVGMALCYGPQGPCGKPEGDNVVLRSTYVVQGPGGAELFRTADRSLEVAYAGWDPGAVGHPNPRRLHLAPVHVQGADVGIG